MAFWEILCHQHSWGCTEPYWQKDSDTGNLEWKNPEELDPYVMTF